MPEQKHRQPWLVGFGHCDEGCDVVDVVPEVLDIVALVVRLATAAQIQGIRRESMADELFGHPLGITAGRIEPMYNHHDGPW